MFPFSERSGLKIKPLKGHPSKDASSILFFKEWGEKSPKNTLLDSVDKRDFLGKEGEIFSCRVEGAHYILVGLGKEDPSLESVRSLFGSLGAFLISKSTKEINIDFTDFSSDKEIVYAALEALLHANYTFSYYYGEKKKETKKRPLENISFKGVSIPNKDLDRLVEEACAVDFARNLINGNACEVDADFFVEIAKKITASNKKVKAIFLRKKEIEKEGLALLGAVNAGSAKEPLLLALEYKGNPKSKENHLLVGKGVSFDTGGLNLKPTGSIETMRSDMGGAATVMAAFMAAVKEEIPLNVVAVIAVTDNAISATAFRPGDIYPSYKGITVEIGNTDAEGRLILADALAWAEKKFKPTSLLTMATLTGAISIALGSEAAGIFSADQKLSSRLETAALESGDRVWAFPFYKEYREQLKSDYADISNVGGRSAGSITAALFLKEFVDNISYIHVDIAGVCYVKEPKRFYTKHASGYGVKLLLRYLDSWTKK